MKNRLMVVLLSFEMGCAGVRGCGEPMNDIRAEAERWLREMGYEAKGFSCSDVDSDGDGYVSCTVNLKERSEPLLIECRAWSGHGCKGALPKLQVKTHVTH